MKTFRTEELLESIINDSIWSRNGISSSSAEYQGILELQNKCTTSNFSRKTLDVLKDKGVLFDISDKEPMALHLVLSEEEREIYKYNTETLPYKAGQVHAFIDAVFYNYWRENDASWSYPSYERGIYRALMFKLLCFDGFLFEDYIHSIDFAKDIDDILRINSSTLGYKDAREHIKYSQLLRDIICIVDSNRDIIVQIESTVGNIDALLESQTVSPEDYLLLSRISEVLNIETTDSRIIAEVHNEIERTTPYFFTMTVPNVLMRHKKIQEQKANSDM